MFLWVSGILLGAASLVFSVGYCLLHVGHLSQFLTAGSLVFVIVLVFPLHGSVLPALFHIIVSFEGSIILPPQPIEENAPQYADPLTAGDVRFKRTVQNG